MFRKMTAKPSNMETGKPTANRFRVGAALLMMPKERFTTSSAVIAGSAIFSANTNSWPVQTSNSDSICGVRPLSEIGQAWKLCEELDHRQVPVD